MRNGWFCWINLICMIAVVHAHLIYSGSPVAVKKMVTLAVPLFSMIIGYSWGGMLKKTKGEGAIYGLKLFFYPYLFWALIYFVLNRVVLDVLIRHGPFSTTPGEAVYLFVTGMVGVQLWFMPALIFVAVLVTLLYRLNLAKPIYVAALAILGVGTLAFSSIPMQCATMSVLGYVRSWMCWMVPNFVFGLLFSIPFASKYTGDGIKHFVLPVLWATGLISIILVNCRGGETMLALAIFLTALVFPKVRTPKWVIATASYIMGIYFSHVLLTSLCNFVIGEFGLRAIPDAFAWPLSVILLLIAWGGVYLMRKMPVLRNVV